METFIFAANDPSRVPGPADPRLEIVETTDDARNRASFQDLLDALAEAIEERREEEATTAAAARSRNEAQDEDQDQFGARYGADDAARGYARSGHAGAFETA
ncbi:MAG: hypothetical protein AAFR52_07655 [Pseudomonadota bacterium]